MSAHSDERVVLDWREIAPIPEDHECDCRFCDMGGDQEPVEWPILVVGDGGGVDYVTDRFLMVRADLAPIPDGYGGTVLTDRPKVSGILAASADVSDAAPTGRHFRWSTLKALALTGWDLRLINGVDTRAAVVDRDGQPIGVAVIGRHERDSVWDRDFTRAYEQRTRPEASPQC